MKHTGLLAVGGDHISNDLAYGLKVPLSRAEQLKIEHGAARMDDSVKGRTVALTNSHGLAERSINLEHLRRIMALRMSSLARVAATISPLRTPRERDWPTPMMLRAPASLTSPTTAQIFDVPTSRPTMTDD